QPPVWQSGPVRRTQPSLTAGRPVPALRDDREGRRRYGRAGGPHGFRTCPASTLAASAVAARPRLVERRILSGASEKIGRSPVTRVTGGKSGLHRAGCWLTARGGNPTDQCHRK